MGQSSSLRNLNETCLCLHFVSHWEPTTDYLVSFKEKFKIIQHTEFIYCAVKEGVGQLTELNSHVSLLGI
jgi:hypothetical protein